MLITACNADGKIRVAPGKPSANQGWPPRITISGDMLLVIRFPGAIEFANPGCGSNIFMVLLSNTPVPGTVTFDPNGA